MLLFQWKNYIILMTLVATAVLIYISLYSSSKIYYPANAFKSRLVSRKVSYTTSKQLLKSFKNHDNSCALWEFDEPNWTVVLFYIPTESWRNFTDDASYCHENQSYPPTSSIHSFIFPNKTQSYTSIACPNWDMPGCPNGSSCQGKLRINTPPCCKEVLIRLFHTFVRHLDRLNVTWYPDGGTLLGAARNGRFIPYDYDADLSIDMEHRARAYLAISLTIHELGARIPTDDWTPRIDALTISLYGMVVDIWFFHNPGPTGTIHIPSTVVQDKDASLIFPLTRTIFEGYNISVPAKIHELCVHLFGEDYLKELPCD